MVAPGRAGRPRSGLHLVDHEQGVVAEAEVLHGQQEFGAQMAVAPLALNGLGDETRDVVRVRLEGGLRLGERQLLGSFDLGQVGLKREAHCWRGDPRPVELRVTVGLDRVCVGQREGVTAPAVEGVPQVQDLAAELR